MEKNKYLEKIAEFSDKIKGTAELGLGAAIASGSSQRLLGYHTVYHGTTKANADSIKKNGFDPKEGGGAKGAGHVHPSKAKDFKHQSTGKVHVTKNPFVAAQFAAFQTAQRGAEPGMVKARISDSAWNKFEADPHMGNNKWTAATTTSRIDPHSIAGGKGHKGPFQFFNKKHLKGYYGTGAGKVRALKGLGMLASGGLIAAHGLNRFRNKPE